MNEDRTILLFNAKIDLLLGLGQNDFITNSEISSDSHDALNVASRLIDSDFQSIIRPQSELRARWIAQSNTNKMNPFDRKSRRLGWAWATLVGFALIAGLLIYRQPILASAIRLFGYGYVPQAGFIQLDTARLLRNSIKQDHAGRSLTVVSGLSTPKETDLWLEYNADSLAPDGALLITESGETIKLKNWNWDSNKVNSQSMRLEFPALPIGTNKMTLVLPEGWRLPLEWIPATQGSIPSSEVGVPYPATMSVATQSTSENTPTPCTSKNDMQVCLKAAQTDPSGTRVLLEATSLDKQLTPGGNFLWLIMGNPLSPDLHLTLTDDLGKVIVFPEKPYDPSQIDNGVLLQPLTFPSVSPQAKTLTLSVPAFVASTTFSAPIELKVDLGANPQNGGTIQIDESLSILGHTVRFRQASLEGDGNSSLHLTLISDPVESKDGMLISMLNLGKPDGIDDGYGSANINDQGQLKVFTELIGSISGKKTGVLIFPIIGAQVLLAGPFDFIFPAPLPTTTIVTQTPQVVSGENFTPQPTPTPLDLSSYHFDGTNIHSGDLLYTSVGDNTTDLFASNAQDGWTPKRIAILPGQVYQIYVHPDRLGIDYLAGTKVTEDSVTFYRSIQLFTLHFDSQSPRLLASFPRGPDSVKGTELTANWSFDGKLIVFQLFNFSPKQEGPYSKIGWIDMSCRDSGSCQPQYIDLPTGVQLSQPQFSPKENKILFLGADETQGSHAGDIYVIKFDSNDRPGPFINLTNTDQVDEWSPQWLPDGHGFLTACADSTLPVNEYNLCKYGITPGPSEVLTQLPFNMHSFSLSPDGKSLIDQATIASTQQEAFRIFDLNSHRTTILKQNESPDWEPQGISIDSQYLGFLWKNAQMLTIISLATGKENTIFDATQPGRISWLGWVP